MYDVCSLFYISSYDSGYKKKKRFVLMHLYFKHGIVFILYNLNIPRHREIFILLALKDIFRSSVFMKFFSKLKKLFQTRH